MTNQIKDPTPEYISYTENPLPETVNKSTPTLPKPLMAAIAIFLLLATIITFYLIHQSQTPTRNPDIQKAPPSPPTSLPIQNSLTQEKTYYNPKYNYAVTYTSNPEYLERSCGNTPTDFDGHEVFLLTEIDHTLRRSTCYPIEWMDDVQIWITPGDTTSPSDFEQDSPAMSVTLTPQSIGDKAGILAEMRCIIGGEGTGHCPHWREARVFHNGQTYTIAQGSIGSADNLYYQILSTFEFTDITDTWETYDNQEKGYTVKYPSSVFDRQLCLEEELLLAHKYGAPPPRNQPVDCGRGDPYSFEIQTTSIPHPTPVADEYYSVTTQNIFIDKIPATIYTSSLTYVPEDYDGMPWKEWFIQTLFQHNSRYYKITFGPPEHLNLFLLILSTFEFIESSGSKLKICPNEWYNVHSCMSDNCGLGEHFLIEVNGELEQKEPQDYDLEWIKNNCEISSPSDVG